MIRSVTEDDALRAVECVGARNDDLIAGRQSLQDLDFGDAGGAELHRTAFCDIVVNDVGKAAAFLIDWAANLGIAVLTKTSHPAAFMLRICESTVGSVVS